MDSFADWLARLRTHEDAAAHEMFERYVGRLTALARRQFGDRLAARADPEDAVQSAFKSFFVRQRAGKVAAENWNSLWGLLAIITLRKCADRVDYFQAARRDVKREVSAAATDESPQFAQDREPLPEEAAILAETVEGLFRSLDAEERPVLELSLQGYTALEISAQLGRAVRSVHRLRERVRKRLERLRDDD